MSHDPRLIYDVGVYDGADSAYYLHEGYRVVGIEANPELIPQLEQRFGSEIAGGRYILLNIAIGTTEGEASFWVSEDSPSLSSLDRELASFGGAPHRSVPVRTRRFRSILQEFGTPFYAKIDIEGSDHLCVDDLVEPPPFLSVELGSEQTGEELIAGLEEVGYRRFKIISQLSFRQPPLWLCYAKAMLPSRVSNMLTPKDRHVRGEWSFPSHASGPFGELTQGKWLTPASARKRIRLLHRNPSDCDRYDVHAGI
jgi:FkbM family methyltransferase